MSNPLVSVIIPNYNHASYLDQRIQSVLNQTYNNFEVIILDDKSPDNSVEVIRQYENNPHVSHIVINNQNSGSTFVQWKRGLELAKGDIIWIAESDDYCEPTFLQECVSGYISMPGCVVAYCTSEYVDASNNDLGTYCQYDKPLYQMTGSDFVRQRNAFGCAIWNASSAIFSKAAALSIDECYQSYKMCGDKLFWILMAEKGNVVHVNKIMNYFRQHQNKVSPKRFRDGTWLTEEFEIFKYQNAMGYLSGMQKVFILSLYYGKISNGEFDSCDTKQRLLHLWGFDKFLKRQSIMLLSRLYQYYHIYILHKRPI